MPRPPTATWTSAWPLHARPRCSPGTAPGRHSRKRFIALYYLGQIGNPANPILPVIDDLAQDRRILSGIGSRTSHELADDLHCQTIALSARSRIAPPLH
ncbi:hypothetical protein CFP71_27870 [Amycolatopsis thailandensis]|uniref:Uncharacterized protein n=1 Tax=Amycolatopsis thailandensis TaxID=589330 RepID=A0A229RUQ5_9PSEU|nr:hypothetical protein [Amycolatopsis thailandensis]OXM50255.1 hypothetical protein CFP71_27870 [Amycolatopsis thailandensis]